MTAPVPHREIVSADGSARILETGYRSYDGPRLGPRHATWTLARHSFERIMGLKRPARNKILPFGAVAIAYLPAIAFIGITALIPRNRPVELIASPGRYYGFVTAAIVLFAALAAPEALCPDKRSRFLGIYLASPLTRVTYLLAKAAAVITALALVTLGPPLLMLIGMSLQNAGPRGFGAWFGQLGQVLLAGTALAVMFGAVALAIPSLTDRRGFASAGALLMFLGSVIIARIISVGLQGPKEFMLLALGRLPFDLALRIFTEPGLPVGRGESITLPNVEVIGASVAVTAIAAGVTWWRVVGLKVNR